MAIPIFVQQNPMFQPAMRQVIAVTNAQTALVTTSFAHNYVDGAIVRLTVPQWFGMKQINKVQGTITNNGNPAQFFIDIDTTKFDPFVIPADQWWYNVNAYVLPVGSVAETLLAATHNTLT